MILSYSKNFIFIHLEKCGGTSIEEALTPYLKWDDWICGGTTFGMDIWRLYANHYKNNFIEDGLWKHASTDKIKEYIGSEKYYSMYKFTTVRDPIDIMHSSYYFHKNFAQSNLNQSNVTNFNKVVFNPWFDFEFKYDNGTIYTDDRYQSFHFECMLEKTGIDSWIEKMIKSNHLSATSQIDRIGDDVDIYDISTINDNWNIITKKIGINENVKLDKLNKTNGRPKNIMLKNTTVELIKEQFKKDYEIIPKITGIKWK